VKYTARDRALAIQICQAAFDGDTSLAEAHVEATGGVDVSDTWTLANQARLAASFSLRGEVPDDGDQRYHASCALAAKMLADGWSPGDPVVGLGGGQ
jgi:hypothetical protein